MSSRVRVIANLILSDAIASVFRFPLWWYTTGLQAVAASFYQSLAYRWRSYAIGLWIRHFFVPMYGSVDWTGRLVSMLMRFVVIFARSLAFGVEALAFCFLLLGWLCLPFVCLLFLLLNLSMNIGNARAFI